MSILFSVITPYYDSLGFVNRYFESLSTQTEKSFEIVICLTPKTSASLEFEVNYIKTAHAKYFKGWSNLVLEVGDQKLGPGHARNLAAMRAKGAWLAFLDIDDTWTSNKLAKVKAAINEYRNIDLFHHGALVNNEVYKIVFNDSDKDVMATFVSLLYEGNQIANSSVVLKAVVFQSCGGYDSNIKACEDWELWLRITSRGHLTHYIRQSLMTYFVHGNNMHYLRPDENLYWITYIFNAYSIVDNELKRSLKDRFFSKLFSRVSVEHFRLGNRLVALKYSLISLRLVFFSKYSWSAFLTNILGVDFRKIYWSLNKFKMKVMVKK